MSIQATTFPQSTVQSATDGEYRKYKITDISKERVVLKEVEKSTDEYDMYLSNSYPNQYNNDNKLNIQNIQTDNSTNLSEKLRNNTIILSANDIKSIESYGKSIENMTVDELSGAIDRLYSTNCGIVDKNVDNIGENADAVDQNVDKSQNKSDKIDDCLTKNGINSQKPSEDEEISDILRSTFFSINNLMENPFDVNGFIDMEKVNEKIIDDDAKRYLLVNSLNPTVMNVYKAMHSGSSAKSEGITDTDYSEIISQVDDVIKSVGIEPDDSSRELARWILDNDIPLTTNTYSKGYEIDIINNTLTAKDVLDKVMQAFKSGIEYSDISLVVNDSSSVQDKINEISDEAIDIAVNDDMYISIKSLSYIQTNISAYVKEYGSNSLESNQNIAAITVRRQLEEIRLTMTSQRAMELSVKGISIDTTKLSELVDQLKSIENSYYNAIADGNANVSVISETMQAVSDISTAPMYILGSTLDVNNQITLTRFHTEAVKAKADMSGLAYEVLMTTPRRDMGDTIAKAFRNVDDILADMGLELTSYNQRAVRILGYNSMEISYENISSVKEYDMKVQELISNLTPTATVSLIKQKINPLETTIDELNDILVNNINDDENTQDDQYAKYLWQLDKKGELTPKERESYIGIYRLINAINKSDSAVIGAVSNAGMELTLSNLLTAVRTRNNSGIDEHIDDHFGLLSEVNKSGKDIRVQIQSAYVASSTLRQLGKKLTPDVIDEVNSQEDIMQVPIEKLLDIIDNNEVDGEDTTYYESKLNMVRQYQNPTNNVIDILDSLSMPHTMSNITVINSIVNSDGMAQTIKQIRKITDNSVNEQTEESDNNIIQLFDDIPDSFSDRETVMRQYENIAESVNRLLSSCKDTNQMDSDTLTALRSIGNNISMTLKLSQNEHYEIPVLVDKEVTNINLTVIRNSSEKNKIDVSYTSQSLGLVSAEFRLESNILKGMVVSDSREGIATLKSNSEELTQSLKTIGISVERVDYIVGSRAYVSDTESAADSEADKTSDRQLYRAAGVIVTSIKKSVKLLYSMEAEQNL